MKSRPGSIAALFIFIFVLLCKGTDYGNCNSMSPGFLGGVPTIGQEAYYLCWAAVGEMIMQYNGVRVEQCTQANDAFGLTVCCKPASRPKACNDRHRGPVLTKYGFTLETTDNKGLTWAQLKNQIDSKRPFISSWRYFGENDDGHEFVVSGYCDDDNTPKVYVRDPLPTDTGSARWLTYSYYKNGNPKNQPGKTYYNIRKK